MKWVIFVGSSLVLRDVTSSTKMSTTLGTPITPNNHRNIQRLQCARTPKISRNIGPN